MTAKQKTKPIRIITTKEIWESMKITMKTHEENNEEI